MLPILQISKNDRGYRTIEMEKKLAKHFSLTEEEKNRLLPSGQQTVLYCKTTWAMFHLMRAGLLARESRVYSITPDGKSTLRKGLSKIDQKFLMSIPKYAKWKIGGQGKSENESGDQETPLEMVEAGYTTIKQLVEGQILERIMACPPEFLEKLVLKLLKKMGYGISGQSTPKTRDGGIDGVIWEDRLKLNAIYIQAKRWKTTVPIAEVRKFIGSLSVHNATKGVMVTPSDFPESAHNEIKQSPYQIKLINGHKLAEYMYEYDLGVALEGSYVIKKLDESFFE